MNILVNLLLVSAGALIGMSITSLTSINRINEEREMAYRRGLERGRREGSSRAKQK